MSTPYGGNDPRQWGQAPQQPPQSGGLPAQGYPQQPQPGGPPAQGYPQQPHYGQYPQQPQQPQQPQYGQQPGHPPQPQYGQYPQQPQQPYYGQQPGAYDYGQSAPDGSRDGRGKLLWITTGALAFIVVVLGITGFWRPGFFVTTVLDQTAVQNGVKQMLATYGVTADSVSCPAKQAVKTGNTFTCTATIGGKQQQVTVTITDENGDYQVGHPA